MDYNHYYINYLDNEYGKYFHYIQNFQTHIIRCYKDGIIERNIKNMYIEKLLLIFTELSKDYDELSLDNIQNENYDINYGHKLYKKFLEIDGIKPFNTISKMLLESLGDNIGFFSIKDGINLILENYNYELGLLRKTNHKFDAMFKEYSRIFIPISYSVNVNSNVFYDKDINGYNYYFSNNNIQNYLVEIIDLNFNYNGMKIIFSGYINHDNLNLNIRGARIINKNIYNKINMIRKICYPNIPDDFITKFINNTSIEKLLCMTPEEYCDFIKDEYNSFLKIQKDKFTDILQNFIRELSTNSKVYNFKKMLSTMKLLLIGNTDSNKVAQLLFDILKENRDKFVIEYDNLIYDRLFYESRVLIKKTSLDKTNNVDTFAIDDIDYTKVVQYHDTIPYAVKQFTLDKIKEMKMSSTDQYKQQLYIKTVLNYPWSISSNIFEGIPNKANYLDSIMTNMDKEVFGHYNVKNMILEIVGKWLVNPNSSGTSIGLTGPPGTGKTMLARSLGKALSMPLVQIALGGQNSGDILYGHSYSYVSAQPGIIVKKMIEAGSSRCIIFFDELDKTSTKNNDNELQNALVHLTDPATNKEFHDKFFQEFTFPLNNVLFIFSYNTPDNINKVLLDRIIEVEILPYTENDKINIVNSFIINEISASLNFDHDVVTIPNNMIKYIITNYTNEPGIRELKRCIEKIFLKVNLDRIFGNKNNIIIDNSNIVYYLGYTKINTNIEYSSLYT